MGKVTAKSAASAAAASAAAPPQRSSGTRKTRDPPARQARREEGRLLMVEVTDSRVVEVSFLFVWRVVEVSFLGDCVIAVAIALIDGRSCSVLGHQDLITRKK